MADSTSKSVYLPDVMSLSVVKLRGYFTRYGPIKSVRIGVRMNGTKYGRVTFENAASVKDAVAASPHRVDGTKVSIC